MGPNRRETRGANLKIPEEVLESTQTALAIINAGMNHIDVVYDDLINEVIEKDEVGGVLSAMVAFNIRFIEVISEYLNITPQQLIADIGLRAGSVETDEEL